MKKEFAFSFDGEYYQGNYETVEELIEDLTKEPSIMNGDDIVFIGESRPYIDTGSDAYDYIIEMFQSQAYNVLGEVSEYYLDDIKPEHEKFLREGLDKLWEDFKNLTNENESLFQVHNVKAYKVCLDGRYEALNNIV